MIRDTREEQFFSKHTKESAYRHPCQGTQYETARVFYNNNSDISAHHIESAMRQIHDFHHPEHQFQARSQQKQQDGK